jgi:uracil-DNA glycosylase family 4
MSDAGDQTDPTEEARRLMASAGALVRELIEEGVSDFSELPPLDLPSQREAPTAPPTGAATRPTARTYVAAPKRNAAASNPVVAPSIDVPWADGAQPTLESVRAHLGECTRCDLCRGRQSIVFGDGNPDADLMFIGEGPGEQEDLRGLPFVGRAGDLLTQMIEKGIGIPRSDVYICNIVKCRPPQNRNPLPPEVAACRPFLDGQIRAVAPKVIVTLGKPAASLLLGRDVAITRVRGTWQEYQGIPLMPTLHPAYVLRQYTTENRSAVWQDLKSAIERTRA